jgi:hypothetical protein
MMKTVMYSEPQASDLPLLSVPSQAELEDLEKERQAEGTEEEEGTGQV